MSRTLRKTAFITEQQFKRYNKNNLTIRQFNEYNYRRVKINDKHITDCIFGFTGTYILFFYDIWK